MKKIKEEEDPETMSARKLQTIVKNPNHPLHTHAKMALNRRKQKTNEEALEEQMSPSDRMASTVSRHASGMKSAKAAIKSADNRADMVKAMNTYDHHRKAHKISVKRHADMNAKAKANPVKTKEGVNEYGGPPISRAKYLKQKPMQNEISKDMVGRYLKKTPASSADAADKISHSYDRMKYDKEGGEKLKKKSIHKFVNRHRGVGMAADKLTGKAKVPAK